MGSGNVFGLAGLIAIAGSAGVAPTAAAGTGLAQVGDAEEYLLEFFAPQNFVNGTFSGVYLNGNGDVGVLGATFGDGTVVTINQASVFEAGNSGGLVNPGTAPSQMGISLAGGWAYGSFAGTTSNQTIVTDAGLVLT